MHTDEEAHGVRHIYVPVDNSEYSNRAIDVAVQLARAFGARLTGCHVYAARLHDYRFKQMEYTLPEEYKDERELERQRKIHDSLIAMGLQFISESYLDVVARKAEAAGLGFEPRMFDGKHHKVLVEDIQRSGCDLVVMGALGMGAGRESLIGSVTDRVVRQVAVDTLVVRLLDATDEPMGGVLVVLDGSRVGRRQLEIGLALARVLGVPIQALSVADPARGDLAVNASRARDLEWAQRRAAEVGLDLSASLLEGNPFERILQFARKERPWLLLLGRTGADADEREPELGATAARLLRLAPANIYLTAGR